MADFKGRFDANGDLHIWEDSNEASGVAAIIVIALALFAATVVFAFPNLLVPLLIFKIADKKDDITKRVRIISISNAVISGIYWLCILGALIYVKVTAGSGSGELLSILAAAAGSGVAVTKVTENKITKYKAYYSSGEEEQKECDRMTSLCRDTVIGIVSAAVGALILSV